MMQAEVCCAYCGHDMRPEDGSSFWYHCSNCLETGPKCIDPRNIRTWGQMPVENHSCLTVSEICRWRKGESLTAAEAHALLGKLTTNCAGCWQAIDEAQEITVRTVLPSDSLEIRMLRTLTMFPIESCRPTHRRAIEQVRKKPSSVGILRLLYEEALDFEPPAIIAHLHAVVSLCTGPRDAWGKKFKSVLESELGYESQPDYILALLNSRRESSRSMHDLLTDLGCSLAQMWAGIGDHSWSFTTLDCAEIESRSGNGGSATHANLLIARGHCEFLRGDDVATWRPRFANALYMLRADHDEPRCVELLDEMACRLSEAGACDDAHGLLLEAVRLGDGGFRFLHADGADQVVYHSADLQQVPIITLDPSDTYAYDVRSESRVSSDVLAAYWAVLLIVILGMVHTLKVQASPPSMAT